MEQAKKINLLSDGDYLEIFGPPQFSSKERSFFFRLNKKEQGIVDSFKTIKSKIIFILQLGIFKKKKMFFSVSRKEFTNDLEYIRSKYFPDYKRKKSTVSQQTIREHQRIILSLQNFRKCGPFQRKRIEGMCHDLSRVSNRPEYIFRKIKEFLDRSAIILPSYRYLQDTIGKCLSKEKKRLLRIVAKEIKRDQSSLKEILELKENGNLQSLKEEMKNFSFSEIKKELDRLIIIKKHILSADILIEKLKINSEGIQSYSDYLQFYWPSRLSNVNQNSQILYLTCFISFRYKKNINNLVNAFIYHSNKIQDSSRTYANEKISELREEFSPSFNKIDQLLELFLESGLNELTFKEVKKKAFSLIPEERLKKLISYFKGEKFDRKKFEWEFIDQNKSKVNNYLKKIILELNVQCNYKKDFVLESLKAIKRGLINTKKFSNWRKNVPLNLKKYLVVDNDLLLDRFEYFIFKEVKDKILSGDYFIPESIHFKSFEDDLLPPDQLDSRYISRKTKLPLLKREINKILDSLDCQLEQRFTEVNKRIQEKDNPYIKSKKTKNGDDWFLRYEPKDEIKPLDLFKDTSQINIDDVLRIVDSTCNFTSSFKGASISGGRGRLDKELILASIISYGTNLGIYQMSQVSNVDFKDLLMVSQNYLRQESLRNASTIVAKKIKELPIFKYFAIDFEGIHSSSDGQKFETQFDTIKSRYSSKYFGLDKGVSDYGLIAANVPINAKIIGSNEYEGHFVFDLLHNNPTEIIPQAHSTDSHGVNQVNFAILDFFGYYFAPRIKRFSSKSKNLYSFHPCKKYKGLFVRPSKTIDKKLIIEEWESIRKIIFSLERKSTSQSIIIQKLGSYQRKNRTKKALWEYNNIIRSIYYLDYIDDLVLRQNVQKSLNVGEHYHQLKRSIAFANFGRLKAKNEIELTLWSESCRLIANCIIYYNSVILSSALSKADSDFLKVANRISPIAWKHINFYGTYEFKKKKISLDLNRAKEMISHPSEGIIH